MKNVPSKLQLESNSIRLPIVEVEFAVRTLKSPKTRNNLVGVRRQIVERATQVLQQAKRNQIDGQVELDVKDIGLVLQATFLTIEWQGDLLNFRFEDDEQI